MKEFSNEHGTCLLDEQNIFWVDGKQRIHNVKYVTYMPYKRNTYAYVHLNNGTYSIYGLKERKVLLNNITQIIYRAKSFVIVTFGKGNKEKYYLYHFIDETQSRYIKKIVNHTILENDGVTLTNTNPNKEPIILPEKCKDLCKANEVIDFYAITTNNEILVLAPFPYNDTSKDAKNDQIIFWKLDKYIKYKVLKVLKFKALDNLIIFDNEEEKKLFALVSILYNFKDERVYISNVNNILTEKKITFKVDKTRVTLTPDTIILEYKNSKSEYNYNIFEYDEFFLQDLIKYHKSKDLEIKIKKWASQKLTVDEIINEPEFLGDVPTFRKAIYALNCNPSGKAFYIINNKKQILLSERNKFVENIKNALNEGKGFATIIRRYDLNPYLVKKILKQNHPSEYQIFKSNELLSHLHI